MAPNITNPWQVFDHNGIDSLTLNENFPVPDISTCEVLVKFHAASLNFRDILIFTSQYPLGNREGVVPASDGTGEVLQVGSKVTRFKQGDRVITNFMQSHFGGPLDAATKMTGLGGTIDGTLLQYGVFNENGLVHLPESLNWMEGASLSCAALMARNALYGEGVRQLKLGDHVLIQGTGGVSLFALQFAKSAGAKVNATTSTASKVEALKKLGADYVINYNENPHWGEMAKKFSPMGEGVDFVIEVGGPTTFTQSIRAVKLEGTIALIGFVGGIAKTEPSFLEMFFSGAIIRPIAVGSRRQMAEMCDMKIFDQFVAPYWSADSTRVI